MTCSYYKSPSCVALLALSTGLLCHFLSYLQLIFWPQNFVVLKLHHEKAAKVPSTQKFIIIKERLLYRR